MRVSDPARALNEIPVILVGRTGRRNAAGDRRPAGMHSGQRSGEGDASAGDLCARRVCKSERRSDGNCGSASAGSGDDNRRLRVRAAVDGDGLAGSETKRAGDRDRGRATAVAVSTVVAPGVPTVAMTAVSWFAPLSIMIAWPASKPPHWRL